MRRFAVLLLVLALCAGAAGAEAPSPVAFGSLSFPRDAESIDLGEETVEDWQAFLAFLAEFPNLKRVDMFASPVTRSEIRKLTEAFPDIAFGWTIHLAADHYVRTDQTAFSTLHGSCLPHTSRELDALRYCTELRALDIGHNNVKDLSFLEPLTHLRVLILACNPELKDLSPLANLQDLEYLELFSTAVTDISPLSGLTRLLDLNLANNRIRNWSLLGEMKSLRRLWVPVGNAKADTLRFSLPDTLVVNHGQPTGNGWRILEDGTRDPHYQVIYEMFRGSDYIPFADSAPWPDEPAETVSPDSFLVRE